MTATTTPPHATTADPDAFLRAVTGQAPILREYAEESEALGQVAEPVIDALHDVRAWGMWAPQVMGGAELDPVRSLEIIETLARADGSSAWVLMAASLAVGVTGAFLPEPAVHEVFASQGDRLPVITGQGIRPCPAAKVDGGYQLDGTWAFGSGIKHSQWIHTATIADGEPPKISIVPIERATLDESSWDVLGLRATGSVDYSIADTFVADDWTHVALEDNPLRGGALYKLGALGFAQICHTGWALGITRALLDELSEMARAKSGRAGQLVDSPSFHGDYGRAEATALSARALAHDAWESVTATLDAGEAPSTRQNTLTRLAMYNATWAAEEVSRFAYLNGGTTALRRSRLQRLFRDVHAGTQHITASEPVVQQSGKELAGLAPDTKWIAFGLVPAGA